MGDAKNEASASSPPSIVPGWMPMIATLGSRFSRASCRTTASFTRKPAPALAASNVRAFSPTADSMLLARIAGSMSCWETESPRMSEGRGPGRDEGSPT